MKLTSTQKTILAEMLSGITDYIHRFEFVLQSDGCITRRRELEAVDELISRGLVRQYSRSYDTTEDGITMTVRLILPHAHGGAFFGPLPRNRDKWLPGAFKSFRELHGLDRRDVARMIAHNTGRNISFATIMAWEEGRQQIPNDIDFEDMLPVDNAEDLS